jgi:hypothetical protein
MSLATYTTCNKPETEFKISRIEGILFIDVPLEGAPTILNFLLAMKSRFLAKLPSTFPPYHVSLATKKSILRALEMNNYIIQSFTVTEPLWPAPRFRSKQSFSSISSFIFSIAKFLDMKLGTSIAAYGTRFFLTASKQRSVYRVY